MNRRSSYFIANDVQPVDKNCKRSCVLDCDDVPVDFDRCCRDTVLFVSSVLFVLSRCVAVFAILLLVRSGADVEDFFRFLQRSMTIRARLDRLVVVFV